MDGRRVHRGAAGAARRRSAALLAKRADPGRGAPRREPEQGYDAALWRLLCEQIGVAALAIPEEFGGVGATPRRDAPACSRSWAARSTPSPMLGSSVLAAQALLASGDTRGVRAAAARHRRGHAVAALCWTGADGQLGHRRPVSPPPRPATGLAHRRSALRARRRPRGRARRRRRDRRRGGAVRGGPGAGAVEPPPAAAMDPTRPLAAGRVRRRRRRACSPPTARPALRAGPRRSPASRCPPSRSAPPRGRWR